MLKNRYVFWGFAGLLIVGLLSVGGWFVLKHGDTKQANVVASGAIGGSQDVSTNEPQTIEGGNVGSGITIDGNGTGGQQSSGNAGTSANSLLDPTTFAQYDKYKDAQATSYVDLQPGTGTAIAASSQVAVVYKGWLTNGTLFDETKTGSDGKLQAFSFVEGQHQVIAGWEEGLLGVKEGGVRLLIIPPALGYGATGQGPIPGNSVLVFQVQVVQVK